MHLKLSVGWQVKPELLIFAFGPCCPLIDVHDQVDCVAKDRRFLES